MPIFVNLSERAKKVTLAVAKPLRNLMPAHMRKIVLFSSLTGAINHRDNLDRQTLTKLNQVMHLSTDVSALELPVKLSHVIWQGESVIELDLSLLQRSPDPELVEKKSHEIFSHVQHWLRYGDEFQMLSDIATYLRNGRKYLSMPARLA